jgi:hypothetical protein
MAHAGIIRFMSLRNTSQERRLFCSLQSGRESRTDLLDNRPPAERKTLITSLASLFCNLHPHPKLCKFFAISFDSAKAFDRKIHGSILQFAAEGDSSHKTNPRPRLSHCGASESPKEKPAGAAGRGFRRERRSRDEGLSRRRNRLSVTPPRPPVCHSAERRVCYEGCRRAIDRQKPRARLDLMEFNPVAAAMYRSGFFTTKHL